MNFTWPLLSFAIELHIRLHISIALDQFPFGNDLLKLVGISFVKVYSALNSCYGK